MPAEKIELGFNSSDIDSSASKSTKELNRLAKEVDNLANVLVNFNKIGNLTGGTFTTITQEGEKFLQRFNVTINEAKQKIIELGTATLQRKNVKILPDSQIEEFKKGLREVFSLADKPVKNEAALDAFNIRLQRTIQFLASGSVTAKEFDSVLAAFQSNKVKAFDTKEQVQFLGLLNEVGNAYRRATSTPKTKENFIDKKDLGLFKDNIATFFKLPTGASVKELASMETRIANLIRFLQSGSVSVNDFGKVLTSLQGNMASAFDTKPLNLLGNQLRVMLNLVKNVDERLQKKAKLDFDFKADPSKIIAMGNELRKLFSIPDTFKSDSVDKFNEKFRAVLNLLKTGKIDENQFKKVFEAIKTGKSDIFDTKSEDRLFNSLNKLKSAYTEVKQEMLALSSVNQRLSDASQKFASLGLSVPPGATAKQQAIIQTNLNKAANIFSQSSLPTSRLEEIINSVKNRTGTAFQGIEAQIAKSVGVVITQFERIKDPATRVADSILEKYLNVGTLLYTHFVRRVFDNVIAASKQSIATAQDFGIKIAEIQTIAQTTNITYQEFANTILDLSNKFGQPISDVTEGTYQTFSNQIAQGTANLKFMDSALKFSKATVSTTADAVNLLSGALNAFELSATNAEHLAAVLFKTVELGRIRVSDLAPSFGRVGVLAKDLGISVEEVATALQVLTIQAIKPAEAFTLLNNVMLKLIRPTDEMKEFLKSIGVESGEAAIATYGFNGVLALLDKEASKGSARIAELFNEIRGLRGAFGLTGGALERFNSNLQKTKDAAGSYSKATDIVLKNPAKQFQIQLQEVTNLFTTEFGASVIDVTVKLTDTIGSMKTILITLGKTFLIVGSGMATYNILMGVSALRTRLFTASTAGAAAGLTGLGSSAIASVAALGPLNAALTVTRSLLTIPNLIGVAASIGAFLVLNLKSAEQLRDEFLQKLRKQDEEFINNQIKQTQDSNTAFKESLTEKGRLYLQFTSLASRQIDAITDIEQDAFKNSTLNLEGKFRVLVDSINNDISRMSKIANEAESNVSNIPREIRNATGGFVKETISQQLSAFDELEAAKTGKLQLLTGRDAVVRIETLSKKIQLLSQEFNRLQNLIPEALSSPKASDLTDTLNELESVFNTVTRLRKEFDLLTNQRTGGDFGRAQVLRLNEQTGKLQDVTSTDQIANSQGLDLRKQINLALTNSLTLEQQQTDLLKSRLNLLNEYQAKQQQIAANAQKELDTERERLKIIQELASKIINFKFTKGQGAKPKTPDEILSEIENLTTQLEGQFTQSKSVQELAFLAELTKQKNQIIKVAQAELTKISISEIQNSIVQLEGALTKARQDATGNLNNSGAAVLENLTKAIELAKQFDQETKNTSVSSKDLAKQLEAIKNAFQKTGQVPSEEINKLIERLSSVKGTTDIFNATQNLNVDPTSGAQTTGPLDDASKTKILDARLEIEKLVRATLESGNVFNGAKTTIDSTSVSLQNLSNNINVIPGNLENINTTVNTLSSGMSIAALTLDGFGLAGTFAFSNASAAAISSVDIIKAKLEELNKALIETKSHLNDLQKGNIDINVPTGRRRALGGGVVGTDTLLTPISPSEFVVKNPYSVKFRSELESINRGQRPQSTTNTNTYGDVHLTINTKGSVDAKEIVNVVKREMRRGNL